MGLHVPDPDVDTLPLPEVRRLEHLVGFADAGNIAEKDLEFAPVFLPLLTLDAGEEGVGIGAEIAG